MLGAWTVLRKSFEVFRGPIAFVLRETVLGIPPIEFLEARVASNFSQNRSSGYGYGAGIAMNDGAMRDWKFSTTVPAR